MDYNHILQTDQKWMPISYVKIVLIVLGVVGNGFTMSLTCNRRLRNDSFRVYFFAIAISDSILLIFYLIDFIESFSRETPSGDFFFGQNEWLCRFGVFVYEYAKIISAWLVVAAAAELLLVIRNPHVGATLRSPRRALTLVLFVLLLTFAGCFPFMVISTASDANVCTSTYSLFYDLYSKVVLSTIIDVFIPTIYITFCNIYVLVHYLNTQAVSIAQSQPSINSLSTRSGVLSRNSELDPYVYMNDILAISSSFIICRLPHGLASLFAQLLSLNRFYPKLTLISLDTTNLQLTISILEVLTVFFYSSKFYISMFCDDSLRELAKEVVSNIGNVGFKEQNRIAKIIARANVPLENGSAIANGLAIANGVIANGHIKHNGIHRKYAITKF